MIPDYQSIMRPLLEMIIDGKEHSISELIDQLASYFSLTETEQNG